MSSLIIAIDGFSSCGKSTFAKAIAERLGYAYIDTGAMYRAVTLFALDGNLAGDAGIDRAALLKHLDDVVITFRRNDGTGRNETLLNGKCVEDDIRSIKVSGMVSEISAIREVRKKLVSLQREMGKGKSVVMDGRDIGTAVFPDADIKIFMTAREEVRIRRRYDELTGKGIPADFEEIRKNIAKRDHIDCSRADDPLRQAEDAVVLDNSDMTVAQQMEWFEKILKKYQ
ncbi:MAG: (d)CMP kinase [Bacteroidales bacterium]|jgi:cytidylate kinase|nr:(d)CMP kinase [Bacteroidales bacterium]